jgi:hypothetical protein
MEKNISIILGKNVNRLRIKPDLQLINYQRKLK